MWLGLGYTIPHYRNISRGDIFRNPYSFDFDNDLNKDSVLRTIPGVGFTNYRFPTYVTVSCWVTLGDALFTFTGSNKNHSIVDIASANLSTGYCLYVTKASTGTFLRWSIGRQGAPGNQPPASGGTRNQLNLTNLSTYGDAKVYHILASFNTVNNESKLFIKSQDDLGNIDVNLKSELSNVPGTGNILYNNTTNAFCVGNTSPSGFQEWNGKIDEVAIWTLPFGEPEADQIYNFPLNGDLLKWSNNNGYAPNFKVWYRMGENANFTPVDEDHNIQLERNDSDYFLLSEDDENIVTEQLGHHPGYWLLKNVVNTNPNFDLISSNVLEEDRVDGLPKI